MVSWSCPSNDYQQVANQTGGRLIDIGASLTWDTATTAVVDDLESDLEWTLSEPVEPSTIEAWVVPPDLEPERIGDDDIDYDTGTDVLTIDLGDRRGDQVLVLFEPLGSQARP